MDAELRRGLLTIVHQSTLVSLDIKTSTHPRHYPPRHNRLRGIAGGQQRVLANTVQYLTAHRVVNTLYHRPRPDTRSIFANAAVRALPHHSLPPPAFTPAHAINFLPTDRTYRRRLTKTTTVTATVTTLSRI